MTFRPATEAEHTRFIAQYGRKLDVDTSFMVEPPVTSWRDGGVVVAKQQHDSEADGRDGQPKPDHFWIRE